MFSGSPIKRIGRDRFVRNVLIAIGNAGDLALLPAAVARREDPNPVVAEAAAWAVQRLERSGE
jgi:epoxyqueuosine reductase